MRTNIGKYKKISFQEKQLKVIKTVGYNFELVSCIKIFKEAIKAFVFEEYPVLQQKERQLEAKIKKLLLNFRIKCFRSRWNYKQSTAILKDVFFSIYLMAIGAILKVII